MFRMLAIWLLLASASRAGLVDSDWGASQPTGNGVLIVDSGRMASLESFSPVPLMARNEN